MASFAMKLFLLMITLVSLIRFNVGDTPYVTGMPVPANSQPCVRQEIRTFAKNSVLVNIFAIGLNQLQTTATSDLLSYYRIAGIHGTYYAWNGDTGGNYASTYGYCYHGQRLFPTWHRPYLALYEQAVCNAAAKVIQGFTNGTTKNTYLAALQCCRLPYWDWAWNPSIPDICSTITTLTVPQMVSGKLTTASMRNPMVSYLLQIANDPNVVFTPYGKRYQTTQTVRHAKPPSSRTGTYVSNPVSANNTMIGDKSYYQSAVVQSFNVMDYNDYSNAADSANSVENPHNQVHVDCSSDSTSDGQMEYVDISSYDPIFFFHHCNIDRLFAMWQVLNPNSYVSNNTNDTMNQDTELHPFQMAQGKYWTSRSCRNTATLGYTYPETANNNPSDVRTAINNLYGSSTSSGRKRKRETTDTGNTPGDDVSAIQNDYVALVKIRKCAASTTFKVCFFFGQPATDGDYTTDPNCVGCYSVFNRRYVPKTHTTPVLGKVPLTKAFYDRYDAGEISDMTPKTLREYLKLNLQWRIVSSDTGPYDLDDFKIKIAVANVYISNRKDVLPRWTEYSTIYNAR